MTEKGLSESKVLSEKEFIEQCLTDMLGGWVPIAVYLRMFPEESSAKVHARVKRGTWQRRVHYAAPNGSAPWINLPAIRRWLEE